MEDDMGIGKPSSQYASATAASIYDNLTAIANTGPSQSSLAALAGMSVMTNPSAGVYLGSCTISTLASPCTSPGYPMIHIETLDHGYKLTLTTQPGRTPITYAAKDVVDLQEVLALALVTHKMTENL